MAYINVAEGEDSFVQLDINASGLFLDVDGNHVPSDAMDDTGNVMTVPSLQEVTVNATPGLFRWKQLDSLSEQVVTTPSTNSIALTLVLDDTTFFNGKSFTPGIFTITNEKTLCYFRLYWAGSDTNDRYIEGRGYLSALAPTVNPDSPVWTSPITIEVVGDFNADVLA